MTRFTRHIVSISLATIMLCAVFAACASTTVSADAQGHISYGPAFCTQSDGSSDRVVISGSTPYYQHFSVGPGWGTWKSLNGASTGEAAVTSFTNGRVDVFVRGTDGNLWWKYTTNNGATWTSWAKPGGVDQKVRPGTAPAALKGAGLIWVFWVDSSSQQLYWKQLTVPTGQWTAGATLNGICTSSPAATSATSTTIDVFVRGTTGMLWDCRITMKGTVTRSWKQCNEQVYMPQGSATGYGPAASTRDRLNGIYDLFWVDNNRALQYKQWDPTTQTFVNAKNLGGVCTSPPSASYGPEYAGSVYKYLSFYVRGTDNFMHGRGAELAHDTDQASFTTWGPAQKGPVT